MRTLKNIVTNTFCTFSVLSILFGILCEAEVLENRPYSQVVFFLFLMSIGTTVFVTIVNIIIKDESKLHSIIDIFGCSFIVLWINHLAGWMEFSTSYFLIIFSMVVAVYLLTWFIAWIQSKHDEEDLNNLLKNQLDRRNNEDK